MSELKIRINIEGLKELVEAVRALAGGGQASPALSGLAGAGVGGGQAAPVPHAQPATVPVQQPAAPTWQMAAPMQQPEQPWGMPTPGTAPQNYGQPSQQPGMPPVNQAATASAVPTTAMPQEFTLEQLQVAAAGLSGMGKMPQVMGILQQFGIQAMTELPKERYGEFAIALREAGAQI